MRFTSSVIVGRWARTVDWSVWICWIIEKKIAEQVLYEDDRKELDFQWHDKVSIGLLGITDGNSLDDDRGKWIFVLEAHIIISYHREYLKEIFTIYSDDILLSLN